MKRSPPIALACANVQIPWCPAEAHPCSLLPRSFSSTPSSDKFAPQFPMRPSQLTCWLEMATPAMSRSGVTTASPSDLCFVEDQADMVCTHFGKLRDRFLDLAMRYLSPSHNKHYCVNKRRENYRIRNLRKRRTVE